MAFGWFGDLGSKPVQTRPREQGRQTVLHLPVNTIIASNGILLALDGFCLEPQAIPHALQLCRQTGKRLDILLVNPPKPATLMLGKLLQQLEKEGIDYRLTSGEGELADEIPLYLHRFKHISFVLLACLNKGETRLHSTLHALHRDGYKVLTLLDRENDLLASSGISERLSPAAGGRTLS